MARAEGREQRYVCSEHGYNAKADADGNCIQCERVCAIVEVVYQPEDWPDKSETCRELLEGTDDDPSGVWECSLELGHKPPHLDGENGHTWG